MELLVTFPLPRTLQSLEQQAPCLYWAWSGKDRMLPAKSPTAGEWEDVFINFLMPQIAGMKFYSSVPLFIRFYLLLLEEIARICSFLYVHIQASWSNQGSNQGSFIFSLVTTAATLESCICSGHLEINSRPECILSGHTDLVWGNTAFPSIFILPALDLWWIRAGRRAHRGVKYEMGAAVSATWLSVTQANHQGQW